MSERFDVVVVGAGNAGIPAAIEAGRAGARVLLVEKDVRVGGTLFSTGGHMSGAGTKVQARHGIEDSVESHLADIQRITNGTHRQDLVELAVANAADTINSSTMNSVVTGRRILILTNTTDVLD